MDYTAEANQVHTDSVMDGIRQVVEVGVICSVTSMCHINTGYTGTGTIGRDLPMIIDTPVICVKRCSISFSGNWAGCHRSSPRMQHADP